MSETTWFWVGTVGMTAGAVLLRLRGKRRTSDEESHTLLHAIVCIVAAVSYFSMAVGQGGRTLPDGRVLWFARYLDWSVTTPLLLLGLCITALHGAHRRPALVAAVLGADVLMIFTGLFSAASSATFPKWTWFLISCGAFLAVYAALFGPLRREARARDAERQASYASNSAVLAGLWLLYPILVLLGPEESGLWSSTTETACITVLDLLAKVAYGYLTITTTEHAADADLARGDVAPALVTTHSVPSDAGSGPREP